jgi:hypothetical protein
MNGGRKKAINEWARITWEQTPEQQRAGYHSFDEFATKVKKEWKRNPRFRDFMEDTINKGLVKKA